MNFATAYKKISLLLFLTIFFLSFSFSQLTDTIILNKGIVLKFPRGYQEVIIAPNPIEAALASGKWKAPKKGETVKFNNGETREWKELSAKEDGWFADSLLGGSYVYFSLDVKKKSVMILQAMGNEMVYVNGAPRNGNPYCMKDIYESWEPRFDYSHLPVMLKQGNNDFIFRCQRGRLKVKLYEPKMPVMFDRSDLTIPDFIFNKKIDTWGSIVIINSTENQLKNLSIKSAIGNSSEESYILPVIQKYSVRKIPFHLNGDAISKIGDIPVKLTLCKTENGQEEILDTVTIPFKVLNHSDNHKETFISNIDGSVQYYGMLPASKDPEKPKALILSLHGASVEGINQSGSYFPKTWGHIVAPTNRRPYGFNWEEWGRLDAKETLELIKQKYNIDENRVYLTGHSMGGHGTWHVGSMFPDQFAAIGPSAGWISFWTYRYRGMNVLDSSEIRRMIRRSTTPSETFEHVENYKQFGVYILHGSEDDNVPPQQSRSMVEELKKVHKDFIYYEQPGAGHWWDNSDEPGADCLDWPPMFDFFARHSRPLKERIREINFCTSNPAVSNKNNWLTIDAQNEQLKMSIVNIRFDPGLRRFIGKTENVFRLSLDPDIINPNEPITIELDSQKIITTKLDKKQIWLERNSGKWAIVNEPNTENKGYARYGTFKEAFRNKVIFVYGTKGSSEENEWAFNKARYDAEKLWYQGNGSIDVIPDTDFDPGKDPDRNILLYGNKNTNSAWKSLLSDSPVQIEENSITVGKMKIKDDNLSCIFYRPRAGSKIAGIGIVSGTGINGMKINNRLPYLNPGIGLPDCTIMNSDILTKGEEGVIMSGFFGLDWKLESGEFFRNQK